ncbi:MAG TPA: hypothetical protein VF543_09895 [Pyrinomonadaceae bacterium]|jgi:hypothetical protein
MPKVRSGGSDQRRGAAYQDHSLLFYILSRLTAHPDLEAVIEAVEDAKIIYNIDKDGSRVVITEYVQCKKREKPSNGQIHAGLTNQDRWIKGTFYVRELEDWLVTKREGVVTAKLLNDNPNAFYTALIFGYLTPKLELFVPTDVEDYLPILYPSNLNEKFDVSHSHKAKSLKLHSKTYNKIISEESLKRVRILTTGSPQELETICWRMLTTPDLFGVSKHKVDSVLNELQRLILEASQIQGSITGSKLREIIQSGRMERGIWQEAGKVLKTGIERQANINEGETLSQYDFEHGHFAVYREMRQALEAIKDPGALVVISGSVGSGKTTLCKYLIYKFLSDKANRRAYYLSALPTTVLDDETDFLEQNIHSDTLFIVDDQHLAQAEVFSLIEKFWDYKTSGNADARLVISSKINYGRTESLGEGHTSSLLRHAIQINLPLNSRETVEQLISQIKQSTNLETQLSTREIANLSDGVLGVALIIARCARRLSGDLSLEGIFTAHNLRSQIARWILSYLPELKETSDFENKVVPLFVISAFGLPIPEDYSRSVIVELNRVGFLEPYETENTNHLYRAVDINLAFILQEQYKHAHLAILKDYVTRYPQWLPMALTRVADWKESQETLKQLSRSKFELIVRNISAITSPYSLKDRTNILQAIRSSSRYTSNRVFERWAYPAEQPNDYFFIDVIAKAGTARELTSFLKLAERFDKDLQILPDMAATQLMRDESQSVLSLIKDKSCRLDDAAATIRALKAFSKGFAEQLYKEFTASEEFDAKLSGTEVADDGLSILLRFCEEIKRVDQVEAYKRLETHLPPEKIIQTTLGHISGINTLSVFLLRLHHLQPRLAANLVSELWDNHKSKVESLLRRERYLDTLTQDFYAFSRINKIITIRIANEIFDRLLFLFQNENKFSIIGSTIESTWKYTSRKLSLRLCESMDKNKILGLLLNERRYADKVGRFLFYLSKASGPTAAWFEEQLDYKYFLRAARIPRLRDLIILIRGFLMAASFRRIDKLKQKMLSDPELISSFNRQWKMAVHLSDIGFCLVALIESNLSRNEIRRLLGFNNLSEFTRDIERRFAEADSLLHIANGLYGVAQYNPLLAKSVLRQYVNRIANRAKSQTGHRDSASQADEPTNEFFYNKNLVELGCLLQISSAINSDDARRLVKMKFAVENPLRAGGDGGQTEPEVLQTAVKEFNLGRLTIFLTGLQQSSRHYALIAVQKTCSESNWQKLYEETEVMERLIQYIRALQGISVKKAAEFIEFLFSNHASKIIESLKYEANLLLIANWLQALAKTGQEFRQLYAPPLINSLKEAVEYDSHLWHLLESAEALLQIGSYQEATEICDYILSEAPLMDSVRNLNNWLVLMHKALHIEQKCNLPDFAGNLTRYMDDAQLSTLLAPKGQEILSGFAYQLFKANQSPSLDRLRAKVLSEQHNIIQAATEAPDSIIKLIALILSEAPVSYVLSTIENIEWLESNSWELGLAALLFNIIYADEAETFPIHLNTHSDVFKEFMTKNLNKHSTNLEFALTLYLAYYIKLDETMLSRLREQARARAEDESLSATRWLLNNFEDVKALKGMSYYIWSYLQKTVLRPIYLPWTNDVERVVRFASQQSRQRNLSDLATTDMLNL